MNWLAQAAENLVKQIHDREAADRGPGYDAIVVGSGYGGAVAAARFAQSRLKVCVLERGREYVPGDFPSDAGEVFGHVRFDNGGGSDVYNPFGLIDIRRYGDLGVVVGNALGGGSQINANVALRADPEVLRDKRWPKELRDCYDPLDTYYTRVEQMLAVAPYPDNASCRKAKQLEVLAPLLQEHLTRTRNDDGAARARFYYPPLAVNFRAGDAPGHDWINAAGVRQPVCVGCGDCVTGCNVGAKNTLTMNYLPAARRHGAEIYTGATVLAVRPTVVPDHERKIDGVAQGPEWKTIVYFAYTDKAAALAQALAKTRPGKDADALLARLVEQRAIFALTASKVVLAAGSLGSTEILLRSRRMRLLSVSPQIGSGFSGNGDAVSFGFDQDQLVGAVGRDAREQAALCAESGQATADANPPGPTIAGALDVRSGLPVRDGFVVQEGIIPGPLVHAIHELLTTSAAMAQLGSRRLRHDSAESDPLALNDEALRRTQVYLTMGHDTAAGKLSLKEGRLALAWPKDSDPSGPKHVDEALRATSEKVGAIYLPNPVAHPVPKTMGSVFDSEVRGPAFIPHPLGGCPMGDTFDTAVVNHRGAVFNGETPTSVFDSLYVWDGSIIPTSIGVNPFLTIAALAERASDAVLAYVAAEQGTPPGGAALPPDSLARAPECPAPRAAKTPEPVGVSVLEVLTGSLAWGGTFWRSRGRPTAANLVLRIECPDVSALLRKSEHLVGGNLEANGVVSGTLTLCGADGKPAEYDCSGSVRMLLREPSFALARVSRATWTWVRKVGWFRLRRWFHRREKLGGFGLPALRGFTPQALRKLFRTIRKFIRMANQAGERRAFLYDLRFEKDGRPHRLTGKKTIRYGNNLWNSLLDVQVYIHDAARRRPLACGTLHLDLPLLAEREFLQVRNADDAPRAWFALASMGLFLARVMFKAHFWDFRAPSYPSRIPRGVREEQRPRFIGRLRLPGAGSSGYLYPDRHWFAVPGGSTGPANISIALTRFRSGSGRANGAPVLLLPGFGQSTAAFVARHNDEDLVRHLLGKGFDVWLLDYRTSTALPTSRDQCTLDDVAQHDIPAAVTYIRDVVSNEQREKGQSGQMPPQIAAIGHCMGAATLAMSLLAGRLHERRNGDLRRPMLSAVVFSQVPPFIDGGSYSQARRELAAFFRDVANVQVLNLAADDGAGVGERIVDRILSTLPAEPCPAETRPELPGTDVATCKRVTGIIGPNYLHENISVDTHADIADYFGWASVSVFMQIGKFLEYRRLVSAQGENVYVNDDNIRRYFDIPIFFLHGSANKLFDWKSSRRSRDKIAAVHHDRNPADYKLCVIGRPADRAERWKDCYGEKPYGHFDCLIGKDAHIDVFPHLSDFLLAHPTGAARPRRRAVTKDPRAVHAKLPLLGPLIGWTRTDGDHLRARLWIKADDSTSDPPVAALIARCDERRKIPTGGLVRAIKIERQPPISKNEPGEHVCRCDIDIPIADRSARFMMVGIHQEGTTQAPVDLAYVEAHAQELLDALDCELEDRYRRAATPFSIADLADGANRGEAADSSGLAGWHLGSRPVSRTLLNCRRIDDAVVQLSANARRPLVADALRGTGSVLSFAAACCRYPGTRFEYELADRALRALAGRADDADGPACAFLVGDQIYADAPAGLFDVEDKIERIRARYRQAFATPGFRALARRLPIYMAGDDHEIENNWSGDRLRSPEADEAERARRELLRRYAMSSFDLHQRMHGPDPQTHRWYSFYQGVVPFFVMDTRFDRRLDNGTFPGICGKRQFDALRAWLREQKKREREYSVPGVPKFIVSGSVFAPGLEEFRGDDAIPRRAADNWQAFPAARARLARFIATEEIHNVIFLSGDYHCAAVAALHLDAKDKPPVPAYAIVAPPLYAPFPFANRRPEEVAREEQIRDVQGIAAHCRGTRAFGLNGFTEVGVRRTGVGPDDWTLHVAFRGAYWTARDPNRQENIDYRDKSEAGSEVLYRLDLRSGVVTGGASEQDVSAAPALSSPTQTASV